MADRRATRNQGMTTVGDAATTSIAARPRRGLARAGLAALMGAVLLAGLLAGCSTGSSSDKADAGSTTRPAAGDRASTTAQSTTTTTEPGGQEYTGDDFYAVPTPLPGKAHGDLIRYQEVTPTVQAGATTWRVMYRSESVAGDPIAVTGIVLVPQTKAPAGGRRLLTLAHGTSGIADECAPSKHPGSELLLMGPAVKAGWLVAQTDYEGLGTPGRHPYLVGESEGRSVIDAILAAGSLPNADPGPDLAIAGYSQGGHGSLWANEVAHAWAPRLHVVGTFAGAPATELDVILAAAPRLPLAGFAYMIIAGFNASYPEADPAKILTPEGVTRLDQVDTGCVQEVIASFAGLAGKDLVRADGPGSDPWHRLAVENNPGRVKTPDPILIIHSQQDEVVPVALSGLLLARMCTHQQVVERRVLQNAGGHGPAAPGAYAAALKWFTERFDGTGTVVNTCSQPSQPTR